MGYESCMTGEATGEGLVPQLLETGFAVEDGQVVDPQGYLTGMAAVDGETLRGTKEWCAAYGFEALVAALRRVAGLTAVDIECQGQDQDDRGRLVYRDGRWYGLLVVQACVREDQIEEARDAAVEAISPFVLGE